MDRSKKLSPRLYNIGRNQIVTKKIINGANVRTASHRREFSPDVMP
jgi:hypothetical protein